MWNAIYFAETPDATKKPTTPKTSPAKTSKCKICLYSNIMFIITSIIVIPETDIDETW